MKGRPLIIGLILIAVLAIVLGLVFGLRNGNGNGVATGDLQVPIEVAGASNVGSIGVELIYDPDVLEATSVEAGELASSAMLESNILIAGRVLIGIVDSSGISGDGPVATVTFNIVDGTGTSDLTLQNIEAADADTLVDILTTTSEGNVIAASRSVEAPLITFNP